MKTSNKIKLIVNGDVPTKYSMYGTDIEKKWKDSMRHFSKNKKPLFCEIKLKVIFYIKRTNTKERDLDNMVKFICDVMNGIIYKDDKQIIKLNAEKRFTNKEEKVLLEISEIKSKSIEVFIPLKVKTKSY